MAESTYQDYKRGKSAPPPAEPPPEAPAETPAVQAETPDPVAVSQDSPPVVESDVESVPLVPEPDEVTQSRRRARTENRFQRLNTRARVLEQENAELKGRVDSLQEVVAGRPRETNVPPHVPQDGKPSRGMYDDEGDFLEALIDWKDEGRKQDQQRQEAQQQRDDAQQAERQELEMHAARTTVARQRYRDYDEVVEAADMQISPSVVEGIVSSEIGPDLVYFLAKHPDEAQKLNAIKTPVALGRALARIEAQIQPADSPPASPLPKAPPLPPAPITPVGGNDAVPPAIRDPGQLPYRDYREARKQGRI